MSKFVQDKSGLYLPRTVRHAQMSKAVVFWWSKKFDHIMLPPSPIANPPKHYEKIECVHAHEVDKWSERLRQQEKRQREMTESERFAFEDGIRAAGIAELRENLKNATDPVNRLFLEASIENLTAKYEKWRKQTMDGIAAENMMHCEKVEGVAS